MVVTREMGVADAEGRPAWFSLDHLLLDEEGVPTLVEVKRSSDTRLRREVVGQMLDYASGAVSGWAVGEIRAHAEREDPAAVEELIGPDGDEETFWSAVDANLRAGRLRLVFLADRIPPDLQRVVEFLDAQMAMCEVRAVELKRFAADAGPVTLVTRPVGASALAKPDTGRQARRQWDEASFMSELEAGSGGVAAAAARRVLGWATGRGLRIWYGKGATMGSLIPVVDRPSGSLYPVALWTYGSVEVQFQYLPDPPFDDAARIEFCERLERIPGLVIPRDRLRKRPSFPLALITGQEASGHFFDALGWCIDLAASGR
jgi:hypothetical protein